MAVSETKCKDVDCTDLTNGMDKFMAVVSKVTNF